MHTRKKKRLLIVLLVLLTLILVVSGIIPIVISTRYEKVIKENLPLWVAKKTDSLYWVTIEDISISTFTRHVVISGVRLIPDSNKLKQLRQMHQLPATVFSITVDKMEINSLSWIDFLAKGELACKRLLFYQPKVDIYKSDVHYTKPDEITRSKLRVNKLKADQIQVLKPDISFRNYHRPDSLSFFIKGGKFILNDWLFDPLIPQDSSLFFYAKNAAIDIDSAILKKHKSLYTFKTESIKLDSKQKNLTFSNFVIQPAITKEEYYKRVEFRDEIFTVKFPALILKGFNWHEVSKGNFIVKSIVAEKPIADIYLSRLLPPKPKIRKFPTQLLLNAALPIAIDTLTIRNGQLRYTELSDKSKMEGTLPLTSLNVVVSNITNIPGRIASNNLCNAALKATLFGSSLTGEIKFLLTDTLGAFDVTLIGEPLDGQQLNPITKPIALMEIESLNLERANISLHCDGRKANLNCSFLYNNLDLKMLEVTADNKFKGKGVISFILNKALLYPANPLPGKPVRKIATTIVRNPDQSFFNFFWSAIRQGALLTAGRNPQIADMVKKK